MHILWATFPSISRAKIIEDAHEFLTRHSESFSGAASAEESPYDLECSPVVYVCLGHNIPVLYHYFRISKVIKKIWIYPISSRSHTRPSSLPTILPRSTSFRKKPPLVMPVGFEGTPHRSNRLRHTCKSLVHSAPLGNSASNFSAQTVLSRDSTA